MTKTVGYDLNNAYFYVTSTIEDMARFGSALPTATMSIYAGNDLNSSYFLGVTDPNDPTFFLGRGSKRVLEINAQSNTMTFGNTLVSFNSFQANYVDIGSYNISSDSSLLWFGKGGNKLLKLDDGSKRLDFADPMDTATINIGGIGLRANGSNSFLIDATNGILVASSSNFQVSDRGIQQFSATASNVARFQSAYDSASISLINQSSEYALSAAGQSFSIGSNGQQFRIDAASNLTLLNTKLKVHNPDSSSGPIAQFGSGISSSVIGLYINNNSNNPYYIGVENSNNPMLWIGRNNNKLLWINAQTGFIGVGTNNPQFSMDISGDMRLSGQLYQEGNNAVLTTQTIQSTIANTESISVSSNVDAIDFTNSPIRNIGTARFASNVYVGGTIFASNINIMGYVETVNQTIYNSERVLINNYDDGPALEVKQNGNYPTATFIGDSTLVGIGTSVPAAPLHVVGVTIQQMGDLQRISACAGQVEITMTGVHRMGFVFTWEVAATSEREMMEAEVTFYGSGVQTRTYMKFAQLVNPVDNGINLPGGDIMIDYKQLKYKTHQNIRYVKGAIVREGPRAVRVLIEWRSDVATNYNVNLKFDILVPRRLGYSSVTTFYTKL